MGRKIIYLPNEIYMEFQKEYDRICNDLDKSCITEREYNKYTNYCCLRTLEIRTGKSFGRLVLSIKRKPTRVYMTEKEKKKFTKKVLKLRLEGCSYPQIAGIMDTNDMKVKRYIDEIYDKLDKDTQVELDKVKEENMIKKFYKKGRKLC